MKTVGLRELKNRLSEYVREVRSGEAVLVTDRGEVVAELVPPGQATDGRGAPSGLVALAKGGRLTLGANNVFDTYPDKWNSFRDGFVGQASNYTNGQIPYSRNSNQFGFNGAYYYLTAAWTF